VIWVPERWVQRRVGKTWSFWTRMVSHNRTHLTVVKQWQQVVSHCHWMPFLYWSIIKFQD
jgi:hypothetical protein